MKTNRQQRYASLGGIEKVFQAYKAGDLTLKDIGKKVKVSGTSVTNDLKATFGVDELVNGHAARRLATSKKKRLLDINAGNGAEMTYEDAVACLENGQIKLKGFLDAFHRIVELARPVTGKPSRVRFRFHGLSKIDGPKGTVNIRYAKPVKGSAEYRINRYRFKINPAPIRRAAATLFCLRAAGRTSYYLFPSKNLARIQSLSLKFDEHEKSKYAQFLAKVEG